MTLRMFDPTPDQQRIIDHKFGAFVSACAGAGKTEVLVERARRVLNDEKWGRGVAFLSFTNAAVDELQRRLQLANVLPSIPFPSFLGTFDRFLWHFFVRPLGIPGIACVPRLIADKEERGVRPSPKAQEIPLGCFNRETGVFLAHKRRLHGVDPQKNPSLTQAYCQKALETQKQAMKRGELDFDDLRAVVKQQLTLNREVRVLSRALSARFVEIIVDEAQDCNQSDIEILDWLRDEGIRVKVICDPHQSIFEFRGGVTDQLFALRSRFRGEDQLRISGNFRSTPHICKVVSLFRSKDDDTPEDEALGRYRHEMTPIHLLEYGSSVTAAVGAKAYQIVQKHLGTVDLLPVLATTKDTAAKAVGYPLDAEAKGRTCTLAVALTSFHTSTEAHYRGKAIDKIHRIVLELGDHLSNQSYHEYLAEKELEPGAWRPRIIRLARAMEYNTERFATPEAWLEHVRTVLLPFAAKGGSSIRQRLSNDKKLSQALVGKHPNGLTPRTIHSVKGLQFPAVCVVMPPRNTKAILDLLESGQNKEDGESLRKIYVAVSRAERLLVIAVPKSQMKRVKARFAGVGVTLIEHTT
jgi:DNA helicase-2/ATP-dependent DNA helicase PcrA